MLSLQEKLANSLQALKELQDKKGSGAIQSADLSRTNLQRLVEHGFLQEVMKGWYIASASNALVGDSTSWYTSYWSFLAGYATARFGEDWCLSAEQSLSLISGDYSVPPQSIIRIAKKSNNVVKLPHNTSLLYYGSTLANPIETEGRYGLNLYSLPEALIECSPSFFRQKATSAQTCLAMITDASDILRLLLDKGQSTKAGRLVGAFRNIGKDDLADEILQTMKRFGFEVRENNPFASDSRSPASSFIHTESPHATRLRLLWEETRPAVLEVFPKSKPDKTTVDSKISSIKERYREDAYNSLSIEGYRVDDALIEKVRSGNWNPDKSASDAQKQSALAAKGYWLAFQTVVASVWKMLEGTEPIKVLRADQSVWYQELFAPSVSAGLLKASDLIGYRTGQVYIRGSLHVPLSNEAVRVAMPVLFDLLEAESDAGVRAVLGHFMFVYIHPYMDGNGRIARFLMNALLVSGGYPWTIIPLDKRQAYLSALERASVHGDIKDFALLVASLVEPSGH
jgi:hypothetical protein